MIILLCVLAFLFASLLVAAAGMMMSPAQGVTIEQRLVELTGQRSDDAKPAASIERMKGALKRLGKAAPQSTKEMGKLQERLVQAGYRSHDALVVFFGVRLGLAHEPKSAIALQIETAALERVRAAHGFDRAEQQHLSTGGLHDLQVSTDRDVDVANRRPRRTAGPEDAR